jgi:transcriptional regulator with XRE-family HTH domain
MRWARIRAGFARASDAAEAMQIASPTYRTYERPTEDGGRWPKTATLQRIAKTFRVNWTWLETGQGEPGEAELTTEETNIIELARRIPRDKSADALNAAASVLRSFIKDAG